MRRGAWRGVMRAVFASAVFCGAANAQQSAQLEQKNEEVFNGLQRLIQMTPETDPKKPELYFRLSELYAKRAENEEIKASDEHTACLERSMDDDAALAKCEERYNARLEQIKKTDGAKSQEIYRYIAQQYPNYENIDRVLFALGFDYQQKGETENAQKFYVFLIQNHPDSPHIPDALYNLGEIYFDAGDIPNATVFYRKVTTDYRESDLYNLALHKLGWCYYNKGQYQDALDTFVEVINHANKLNSQGGKARLTRKKEATRDLVTVYVNTDNNNPAKTIAFFKSIAPNDYLALSEQLAIKYIDTGQLAQSNAMYRELIKLYPNTYKAMTFQIKIVSNSTTIGQQSLAVNDVKELAKLWRTAKELPDATPAQVSQDQEVIESLVRKMAEEQYALAEKNKSKKEYQNALDLYVDYLDIFPDSPHLAIALYNTANLAFRLERWELAAQTYGRVLKSDPDEETKKEAAYNMVTSYQNILIDQQNAEIAAAQKDKKKGGKKKDDKKDDGLLSEGAEATIPEPKELSEVQKSYIEATEVYSQYVPDGDDLIEIKYSVAKLYYDNNHFDKAIPIFKEISEKHPNHAQAVFAANLLLDTYNLTKDYDSFNAQVETFLPIYTPSRDAQFNKELNSYKRQANFKRCGAFEGRHDYLEAARCYYRYAHHFKDSEFVDKAYYNSAANYERMRNIDRAIAVRMEMIQEVSGSELVPKALFQIAANKEDLATYSEASEAYEVYAANFPDKEEAQKALERAAGFRKGLGQYAKAIEDSRAYISLVGSDKAKAAEAHFNIGQVMELQEKWYQACDHYAEFLRKYKKYATPDLVLAVYAHYGNAFHQRGGPKNEKASREQYDAAYNYYKSLNNDERQKLGKRGREAISEARFKQAEIAYEAFRRNPLKLPKVRGLEKYIKDMQEGIVNRNKAANAVDVMYREVLEIGAINWSMAASVRIGQMQQQIAQDIYNLEAPREFSQFEEAAEAFKNEMVKLAEQPTTLAINGYENCLDIARQQKWANKWSEIAGKELAQLKPEVYRYSPDILTKPVHFSPDRVTRPYIAALPIDEAAVTQEAAE